METTRKNNLKQARTLQIWNVIYDVIEVVVSLIAGITANSSALVGWALDSTIEVISAATLGWRLHGELKGIDEDLRSSVFSFPMIPLPSSSIKKPQAGARWDWSYYWSRSLSILS